MTKLEKSLNTSEGQKMITKVETLCVDVVKNIYLTLLCTLISKPSTKELLQLVQTLLSFKLVEEEEDLEK